MEEKSVNKLSMMRSFIYVVFSLNLISIGFGIFYYIFRFYSYISNVFGFVLSVTFISNLILTLFQDKIEFIPTKARNSVRVLSIIYIVYSLFSILMMFGGNLLVQITYEPLFKDKALGLLLNMGGYFGLLILGSILSGICALRVNEVAREISTVRSITQKIGAIISQGLCFVFFLLGIYTSITVITGNIYWFSFLSILEYFVPESALILGIFFLSATFLALKLIPRKKKIYFYSVMAIGLSISVIHMIPAAMTPIEVVNSNNQFTGAFGPTWQTIPYADQKYMTRSPYSFSRYLVGMHPNDYIVHRDILYYNGSLGSDPKDENITLYFDVYEPSGNRSELPGRNSTIIRFHGGGLQWYDKGLPNMQKMNYYFASQGYVVFDIQYGLYSDELVPTGNALTPTHVIGNFTIDDIMRHVGIFVQYLVNNSDTYGANINSVFLSGGSAGGLLTCTTAFTLVNGNYTFYGTNPTPITVKGIIPFYPWINVTGTGPIKGSTELLRPYTLVNMNSTPCLIFQGTNDNTVEPEVTQLLQEAYNLAGKPCATLTMYFAGHVSDMVFEGYYNQIFLYYMERFLYLYR